jgi:hypothetical protein
MRESKFSNLNHQARPNSIIKLLARFNLVITCASVASDHNRKRVRRNQSVLLFLISTNPTKNQRPRGLELLGFREHIDHGVKERRRGLKPRPLLRPNKERVQQFGGRIKPVKHGQ